MARDTQHRPVIGLRPDGRTAQSSFRRVRMAWAGCGLLMLGVCASGQASEGQPEGCNPPRPVVSLTAMINGDLAASQQSLMPGDEVTYCVIMSTLPNRASPGDCDAGGGCLTLTLPDGCSVPLAGHPGTPEIPQFGHDDPLPALTITAPRPYVVDPADASGGLLYATVHYDQSAGRPPQSEGQGPVAGASIGSPIMVPIDFGPGYLVQGSECVLFMPDSGGVYHLEQLCFFGPGDHVRVSGYLDPQCPGDCQQGELCIQHNTISYADPLDQTGDGVVDATDVACLLAAWGDCADTCCMADVVPNGAVDSRDLAALIGEWGVCNHPPGFSTDGCDCGQ